VTGSEVTGSGGPGGGARAAQQPERPAGNRAASGPDRLDGPDRPVGELPALHGAPCRRPDRRRPAARCYGAAPSDR